MEGAAEVRILRSVYAPLSVSAALVLFLFQFTWIWNDLLFGIVLTSSPSDRPVMASLSSLMGMYGGSSLPVELAGTLIAASPMLVLVLLPPALLHPGPFPGRSKDVTARYGRRPRHALARGAK